MLNRSLALVAAPLASALALLASPAEAATPTAVEVGAHTTGVHPITVAAGGPIGLTVGGTSSGCTSASASGVAIAGPAGPGSTYLELGDLAVLDCGGASGQDVTVNSCTNGGIDIKIGGGASATGAVTDAIASSLNAGTSASPCLHAASLGGLCQFDLYGSSSATFNENVVLGRQQLTITGTTLTVTGVTGLCPGLSNGDTAGLSIPFTVTSPNGPINVK